MLDLCAFEDMMLLWPYIKGSGYAGVGRRAFCRVAALHEAFRRLSAPALRSLGSAVMGRW